VEASQLLFVGAIFIVLSGSRYLLSETHVTNIRRLITRGWQLGGRFPQGGECWIPVRLPPPVAPRQIFSAG
jgi:hypothetical protein